MTAVLALALLRDSPQGRPPRVPLRAALATATHGVREAWAEPGTRLGFWAGFMSLFPSMMFGVMWGYPFLTVGQGLSPATAGALMLAMSLSGLVYGVALGSLLARHPYYRSLIGSVSSGGDGALGGGAADPRPGAAVAAGRTGGGATVHLDHRDHDLRHRPHLEPPARLGSAIGVVNVGAFLGTLIVVMGIGLVLQMRTPAGSQDYALEAFKWAFATQYPIWALGIVQTLRYRRRTIHELRERDPDAFAAYRRGVHLSPPT